MKKSTIITAIFIVAATVLSLQLLHPGPWKTRRELRKRADIIRNMTNGGPVSARSFACVIFAERINNVNWFDTYDVSRAGLGYNSSVGFCQIRVSTAMWMSRRNADQHRGFPPMDSLICALENDSINIRMALDYLLLIRKIFVKKFNSEPDIRTLASYYSRGVDYGKGMGGRDYSNAMGISAAEYLQADWDRNVFPD